ncbi:MAG: hypothetical protein ACI4VQ_05995 [Clostridia bacterium]
MNKSDLEDIFKNAKERNSDVCIQLTVPTREASEFIIVLNDNLDYKLDYYLKNYNDNLELERFTEIKILDAKLIKWCW